MTQLSPASNVRMSVLVIENSGVRKKSGLQKNFQNYYKGTILKGMLPKLKSGKYILVYRSNLGTL